MKFSAVDARDHRLAERRTGIEMIGVLTEPHEARAGGEGIEVPICVVQARGIGSSFTPWNPRHRGVRARRRASVRMDHPRQFGVQPHRLEARRARVSGFPERAPETVGRSRHDMSSSVQRRTME